MNPYAQMLQASLRQSPGELSPADVDRLASAAEALAPTRRADVEALDAIIGFLVGLGPRPRLTRADAARVQAFVERLEGLDEGSVLDARIVELAADPAVWRWTVRGRAMGTSVTLALRVAALAKAGPSAEVFGPVQRRLSARDAGDLLVPILRADPDAVATEAGLTSVGRALAARLEAEALPWWSELYGRRGVVAVARVLSATRPEVVAAEAARLEDAAGAAVAPELAEVFLSLDDEVLRARGEVLLERAETPEARLAAARVRAARGLSDPAGAARAALEACRLERGDAPIALEACALLVDLDPEAGWPAAVALGARLDDPADRAALAERLSRRALGATAERFGEVAAALAARAADTQKGRAAGDEVEAILSRLPDDAARAAAVGLLAHAKKPARDAAARALAPAGPRTLAAMQASLSSAKSAGREAVASVLAATPGEASSTWLAELARGDRSKKVRELADLALLRRPEAARAPDAAQAEGSGVAEAAGSEGAPRPADEAQAGLRARIDALVERMARHLKKPARPWLDEASLPALVGLDGGRLPQDYLRLMLKLASREKGPRWPPEAELVQRAAEPASARAVGEALLSLFLSRGASMADKFCVVAAIALAGDSVAFALYKELRKWPKSRRGKLAELTVEALTTSTASSAVLVVDAFERRTRTAYPKPALAAYRALVARAHAARVKRADLVLDASPRFGFEARVREVLVGGKRLRVGVDLQAELRIRYDDGKQPKSLPKALPVEAQHELRVLSKNLKAALEMHAAFVEDALLEARSFPAPRWRRAFLEDPVRFLFAARQVWLAVWPSGQASLRALEDGTLVDADGAPAPMPEEAVVRLVHPALDPEASIAAWKAHFEAFRVEPVVAQLDRPSAQIEAAQAGAAVDPRFEGRPCEAFERVRPARRHGWRVEGLYAGASPTLVKTFGGLRTAILYTGMDRALGLEVRDQDRVAVPLGTVPAPMYAQIVHELDLVLSAY